MKTSMYLKYTSRSLLRGGQRTILAMLCVTVGVMAVVALQLIGFMLQSSLSGSAREANGGDILINAQGAPFQANDLTFFDNLKSNGTITNYTAIARVNGTLGNADSSVQSFPLEAVDPTNFPLVSQPDFVQPGNGSLAQLLTNNQAVVTQNFLTFYHKQFGDTFSVYVKTAIGSGQTLTVKIVGVIASSGTFAQSGNLLLISLHDYLASAPAALANYTQVDITTADQTHTDTAVKAITTQFPLVNTQTATDLLKAEQSSIDLLSTFLKIAGLLALLIGGVGIVNTMQVLLSRRKTEIAMLKTAGYHRRDLYLLFGLEAAMLGLIGGVIGAVAAIGVSYLISSLMQNMGTNVPFVLNPGMVIGGVVLGCVTALIFGLLPIVQAANIRPLQVLRELNGKNTNGRVLTTLLLVLLSIFFCLVAIVILNNDVTLGITVTYGTFAALLVLGTLFSLIVFGISKLPVPEHLRFFHLLPVVLGVVLAILEYRRVQVFGVFLLILSLLGLLLLLLPQRAKVNVKMALRNIGRQRTRTTATLLALFIGVFGIGMDVGFAQDLRSLITNTLAQNSPYNLVATTSGTDTTTLQARLSSIPGLQDSRSDIFTATIPLAINGQPAQQLLPPGDYGQQISSQLGGIEGYDLAHTIPAQTITEGRNLNSNDANTTNVLVSQVMTSKGWSSLNIKVGNTITYASLDRKTQKTVTVVGIVSIPTSFETLGEVLAPASLVNELTSAANGQTTVFYMKVPPAQLNQAIETLNQIAPNASVQNLTDSGVSFVQQITSFLNVIIAVASLSLLAGVIIIANAVALAMLERRRELGILKAVGYTSSTILGQILVENGITGGIGAFIATVLAAGGVATGSTAFFGSKLTLNMEPVVIISMIVGPVLLALLTAALVSWNAVRVRPLMVLRYE